MEKLIKVEEQHIKNDMFEYISVPGLLSIILEISSIQVKREWLIEKNKNGQVEQVYINKISYSPYTIYFDIHDMAFSSNEVELYSSILYLIFCRYSIGSHHSDYTVIEYAGLQIKCINWFVDHSLKYDNYYDTHLKNKNVKGFKSLNNGYVSVQHTPENQIISTAIMLNCETNDNGRIIDENVTVEHKVN